MPPGQGCWSPSASMSTDRRWRGPSWRGPRECRLPASAARSAAGSALAFAARTMINVHGGLGATWEHDAPLFFRRAQLSRRLLGGTHDATDRVAERTMSTAAAA